MSYASQFRFYSYGIAVEDREIVGDYSVGTSISDMLSENRLAHIQLVEITPYMHGEVDNEDVDITLTGEDAEGETYTVKLKATNSVPAYYFPLSGVASNVPHLKKGERVLVWKYADEPTYYWTPTGETPELRRDDHHGVYVSATEEADADLVIGENTYTHEVSPRNKRVGSTTSTANGEPVALHDTLDAARGSTSMGDAEGNVVETDHDSQTAAIRNAAGAHAEVSGDQAELATSGSNLTLTPGNAEMTAPSITLNGATALNGPVTIMAAPIDSYIKAVSKSYPPPINPALAAAGLNGGNNSREAGNRTGFGDADAARRGRRNNQSLGGSRTIGGGGPIEGNDLDNIVTADIAPAGSIDRRKGAGAAISPPCGDLDLDAGAQGSVNKTAIRGSLCGISRSTNGLPSLNDLGVFVDGFGRPIMPSLPIPTISADLYSNALAAASRLNCKVTGDYDVAAGAANDLEEVLNGMPGDHNLLLMMCDDGERVKGSNDLFDLLPGCECIQK